ncbi:DUF4352 domain-containing protein [Staphylococcus hominis]|uniref:DUF4352 domain-containing protein n=1 Tax=Staphylococcus hominis TaxID=1290 RepID=UPI0034CF1BC9
MEEKFNNEQEERQFRQFQEYQKQQEEEKKKKRKKGWLWGCGGCLVLLILIIVGISACSATFLGSDSDSDSDNDSSNKTYKVGDTVKKDNIEVTVTNVEYAPTDSEDATPPDNGKALKVDFKFKNNNDDQIMISDVDFTCKVDGENYEQWFGADDQSAGFEHQLNKGNTASGHIYYDVPDADKYTIEMDATPGMENIKAKWVVDSSDIK